MREISLWKLSEKLQNFQDGSQKKGKCEEEVFHMALMQRCCHPFMEPFMQKIEAAATAWRPATTTTFWACSLKLITVVIQPLHLELLCHIILLSWVSYLELFERQLRRWQRVEKGSSWLLQSFCWTLKKTAWSSRWNGNEESIFIKVWRALQHGDIPKLRKSMPLSHHKTQWGTNFAILFL